MSSLNNRNADNTRSVTLTNIIITRLIKYTVAIEGNTAKGIININYKAIIKTLIEIYFEVTAKKNAIFVRS